MDDVNNWWLRVTPEKLPVSLVAAVPQGSRFKGYKSCFVRELVLTAELVHYRHECWVTPEGTTMIASMPYGVADGYGPNLRRLCLALHAQGQVTMERLTTLLNDIGIEISKRQVVRLLTKGLDRFIEEDAAVLHTGLVSAGCVTVVDTGARHARGAGYNTTQIGGEHFTALRTGPSKSRLNFLSVLRGNYQDYVLNDTAFSYLEDRKADPGLLAKLHTREPKLFSSKISFLEHLAQSGIDVFDTGLIRIASEAGTWSSLRHHGLLGNTVIVSDDAGQFRVANHALCWIHAERLLHKLMPSTSRQARQVDAIRDLVWCFYKALKASRQKPSPSLVEAFRHRFERIFTVHTGYKYLDRILARLHRRRHELLKLLEHPAIPLRTNASENDLRFFVVKRKISDGTMSHDGRMTRDTMLGLLKTCRKLGLSFDHYLGDRLGFEDSNNAIPPLASLVAARA